MDILICAATDLELNPIKKQLSKPNIDFALTGIGAIFTTFNLSEILNQKKYDLVINTGICGSYNADYQIGTVLNVVQDEFADLGITDKSDFKTIFDAGLISPDEFPFKHAKLFSDYDIDFEPDLPKASGITVSNASGNTAQIRQRYEKFKADTESMEGAAAFYVCRKKQIPVMQIRAVSNKVEERNRKNWNIPLALENLTKSLITLSEKFR